ncbi:hypothetical protein BBP40_007179 [Aspergillus hancockii]|nr:hypothetical protein BBP40_007179 [Aspergillus hancockii]
MATVEEHALTHKCEAIPAPMEHSSAHDTPASFPDGGLHAVYIFFLLIGGVQIGSIFDRYGPKHLLVFGTIGLTTAVMVFSVFKGIGGIIFPQVFNALASSAGFGWAVRTIGFVNLALCSTGALLQRSRLERRKTRRRIIDLRPLREPVFTLTTIAIMFANVGATPSTLGHLLPGYVADRYGRFNSIIGTTAVSGILTLSLWLKAGPNKAAIISYAALFGFWSGSAISLSPVCVAQTCETEDFGKKYGTAYTFVALGVLVSLPIAGEILNVQSSRGMGEYWGLILFCGLAYIISVGLFVCARGVGTRWAVWRIY